MKIKCFPVQIVFKLIIIYIRNLFFFLNDEDLGNLFKLNKTIKKSPLLIKLYIEVISDLQYNLILEPMLLISVKKINRHTQLKEMFTQSIGTFCCHQ